jgi:hypothetical protein
MSLLHSDFFVKLGIFLPGDVIGKENRDHLALLHANYVASVCSSVFPEKEESTSIRNRTPMYRLFQNFLRSLA